MNLQTVDVIYDYSLNIYLIAGFSLKPGFHEIAKCRKVSQSVAEIWLAAFCNSLRHDVSIGRRVLQNFGAMFQ